MPFYSFCGSPSLVSLVVYASLIIKNRPLTGSVNILLTLLQMYIKENAEGDSGIQRMKNAVWVDLANALLWLISALATAAYWWRHRERRTRFTGRGKV